MLAARRAGARGGVGRQGQPGPVGPAARPRLRRRRAVPRPRHRRLQRRVGRRSPAPSPATRGLRSSRSTSATTYGYDIPTAAQGHRAGAVLGVRPVQAPPVRPGRRRRRLRRASPPATTSTTRPPCCSATCCTGTPSTSAASCRCCPARDGFPRKVKPLVRLGRAGDGGLLRAAGHRLHRRGVPDGRGQQAPRLQGGAQRRRGHVARREGRLLLRVPRAGRGRVRPQAAAEQATTLRPCERCGAPTTSARCARSAGWPNARAAIDARAGRTAPGTVATAGRSPMARPTVRAPASGSCSIDRKERRYLRRPCEEGGEFHTPRRASSPHDEHHRRGEGRHACARPAAQPYIALRPTLADFVLKMPRGAQVIYPKDLGPILMLADIFPGRPRARDPASGRGAVDDHAARRGRRRRATSCATTSPTRPRRTCGRSSARRRSTRYRVELRDCYEGIDERDLDRVVLDLPEPWQVVPHAEKALRRGGILCAYTPSIMQAAQTPRGAGRPRLRIEARDARGAAPHLAHRGPGGAPRPPHGRPHRLPHGRPLARRLSRDATKAPDGRPRDICVNDAATRPR